jgi:hypothetical protein
MSYKTRPHVDLVIGGFQTTGTREKEVVQHLYLGTAVHRAVSLRLNFYTATLEIALR